MGLSGTEKSSAGSEVEYDREKELKAFDDSKAGVKGLIDAGVTHVPKMFIRPPDELAEEFTICQTDLKLPVIDLSDIEKGNRCEEVIEQIRIASEKWGFFHVVNHGIPSSVLDGMIGGIRMFHEQDPEVKKGFYARDPTRRVRFVSNSDLYKSRAASWRDSLIMLTTDSGHLDPDELPIACRDITMEYARQVTKLGDTLFGLLSQALGLKPDHFAAIECVRPHSVVSNYQPACPAPELTLGTGKHTDPVFLTIILEDQLGGLQVLHENQWVDVRPIAGAFIVNIGDLLQMISNDRCKSVIHRVLANHAGPRISVASFFSGTFTKLYGPIKELILPENPPLYREFFVREYLESFHSRAFDKSGIDYFKL